MLYQQRIPTIEAYQITSPDQAVRLIPGSRVAEPRDGHNWAVEWDIERDDQTLTLYLGGRNGEYLIPKDGSGEVVAPAEFLAIWEPQPIDLQSSRLRS